MMWKKTLSDIITELRADENVIHWHELEPVEAKTCPMPAFIDGRLRLALEARRVRHLYTHQYSAFEAVQNGENIVAVTPTASGKTLCYNLPVLQKIAEDETSRALYLFPTKALAQDQKSGRMPQPFAHCPPPEQFARHARIFADAPVKTKELLAPTGLLRHPFRPQMALPSQKNLLLLLIRGVLHKLFLPV